MILKSEFSYKNRILVIRNHCFIMFLSPNQKKYTLYKTIGFIGIMMIFFSCSDSMNDSGNILPPTVYHQRESASLNLYSGYAVNPFTGKNIEPLINTKGDTIITGKPILIKGEIINSKQLEKPEVFTADFTDSVTLFTNSIALQNDWPSVPFNIDAFTGNTASESGAETFVLVNSHGDTLQTGEPVTVNGEKRLVKKPNPVTATGPSFRDNFFYDIQYFGVDHGLPSPSVMSVAEDSRGNLWFGSFNGGVSCYDGVNILNFGEKNGLPANTVTSIIEDSKGNLWFGTYGGGVCKYDGNYFTVFSEKEGLSHNVVWSLLEDSKGNMWFGTYGGLTKYDGESLTHYTVKEGLGDNVISCMLEDDKGQLWFSTEGGGVVVYDGQKFKRIQLGSEAAHNAVMSVFQDQNGIMWFGTWGAGVCRYDGRNISYLTTKEGLSSNRIRSITEDQEGNIWFGTSGGGLNCFDGKAIMHITTTEGLSNDVVFSVRKDHTGNLWATTWEGGINKIKPNSFLNFTKDQKLSENTVLSICQDKKQRVWFGTKSSGLLRFDGKTMNRISKEEGYPGEATWAICEDFEGNVWFGTGTSGAICFDGKQFTQYSDQQGVAGEDIRAIYEDRNHDIWFSSIKSGLTRYQKATDTSEAVFTRYSQDNGLSLNKIRSISEDTDGNIWFATRGHGVSKFDGEFITHYSEKEGLLSNVVVSVLEDKSGNMWFGTEEGVCKFDGHHFTAYTVKQGLVDNRVKSIIEDDNDNIWVSTRGGISSINMADTVVGKKIQSYVKRDGLKGIGFATNSVCFDQSGKIWWSNEKSLVALDLKRIKANETDVRPQIVTLRISEQDIDFQQYKDEAVAFNEVIPFYNLPGNLELTHKKNHLTFCFSAIDWIAPHQVRYSYMIEGLDEEWSEVTSEAKAEYRNLPDGTFKFKLVAIGSGGKWSDPVEFEFTIFPPWWKTIWARIGYVVVVLLLFTSFFFFRTNKMRLREQELKSQIKSATDEIREQHQEITDSIIYAKRIQSAILSPTRIVKEYLEESFILYKPKDVVAGDFYWMHQKGDKILFAAADCTGHGVPGAMVSVICGHALDRSVREYGLSDPGKILDQTREIVIQEFHRSEEQVHDGMDIALCVIEGRKLQYAGAHNPLWIVRDGDIIEIKANKQPVGFFENISPYTTHDLDLKEGDRIYIFSDGYVDQFGGEKGKKFMNRRFKALLLDIQDEDMDKQRKILEQKFDEWRGGHEQVDDVCVIGVSINF